MKKIYKFQNDLIDYFVNTRYTYEQIIFHLSTIKKTQINKKEILESVKIRNYMRAFKLDKIQKRLK